MSRARELAKFGGSGQQVIAGLSSHVGVSTFAANVFMYNDCTVSGNLNVTGDLTYDEVSARNQNVTGITTTADLIVTRNANFSGIITAAKGVAGNINATGVSTITQLVATTVNATGVVTATSFSGPLTGNVTGNVSGNVTGNINATGVSTISFLQATTVNVSAAATVPTLSGTTATYTNLNSTNTVLSGLTTVSNTLAPNANNTVSLGTSANRWSNVFSNDLDLSNEGSANDIDGTWGSFLVQEGQEHLYIINRRSGKKYRFVLEEV